MTPTWCRVCESACGLLAEVKDGRVVSLSPDREHPVSRGYACVKGLRFHERLRAKERFTTPLIRRSKGDHLRGVSWEEALAFTGARLRAIRGAHGPEALGLYLGNAVIHNFGAVVGTTAFARSLGTRKSYSALTLDNAPQYVVLEAVLGHATATFTADYAQSDCMVLFGTDPLASQPSQSQANPDGVRQLLRARERLVVVDPRRSATARHASSHLAIRPGTDRFLLACLVRAFIDGNNDTRPSATSVTLDPGGVATLREAVARFTPEVVSPVVGLTVAEIEGLVTRLRAAERPLVWSGLGVLLGPDATLGWWLTLCLQSLLGGLDRPGGWVRPGSAVNLAPVLHRAGLRGADGNNRSRIGGYPAVLGTHAAATMADDVLTEGADRLRGLVVFGGNPVRACPDSPRVARALGALDLLVSVEAFPSDTTELADVVLPVATWMERWDSTVHMASQKPIPHLQVGAPVVPPPGEARDDWWIATALARAAGRPLMGSWLADWPMRWLGAEGVARLAVSFASGLSWSKLLASPRGLVAQETYGRQPLVAQLAPATFVSALAKMTPSADGLVAVTSVRPVDRMNTWLGERKPGAVTLNRADASRLAPSGTICLSTREGRVVTALVEVSDSVREGAIVMPFGTPVAILDDPGWIVPNALLAAAPLDAFSGQPVSNGATVTLA